MNPASSSQLVVVLGASPNRARFSNKAQQKLIAHGHRVIPVNPGHNEIEGISTVPSLAEVRQPVDTLTVYVGPDHLPALVPQILALKPKRVIFNPGTEIPEVIAKIEKENIPVVQACTLVLLDKGLF